MMRNVYSCTRKHNETTAMYERRFQNLALDYLNHCDATAAEQDSQNFAMLLLENAKIPASVYSTVVTQLVASASHRTNQPDNKIYLIGRDKLVSILERANTATCAYATVASATATDTVVPSALSECVSELEAIKQLIRSAITANERHECEDRTTFRVTLDDAVEVLFDIKVDDETNQKRSALLSKREYDGRQNHHGYGNGQQNHQGYGNGNRGFNKYNNDKRHKTRIPKGQGPKAQSKCKACQQPNHWYKDPECIYNVIRSLMEGRDIESDVVQKLSGEVRKLIETTAGGYKKNVSVSDIIEVIGDRNEDAKGDITPVSKKTTAYIR